MSNYKAGDIIRLTRKSLNISQEALIIVDDMEQCSVQTISRIENGKCRIKKKTYQKLMERMGRNGEKAYAILKVEDFDLLDIMYETNTAMIKHEYEKVEDYIKKIKPHLEDNVVNNQYILKKELAVDYRLGRTTKEEYLEKMEDLLSLTIKNYKTLLEKQSIPFPFMDAEISILISISNVYGDEKKYDEKIEILKMILRSLDTGYMDEKNTNEIRMLCLNNMAKAYGEKDEHQMAVELSKKSIEIGKKYMFANMLCNSYGELAWNMIQQIERGDRKKEELEMCKKYLRQGHAIAAMYEKNVMKNIISDYYKEYFHEEIYDLSPSGNGE